MTDRAADFHLFLLWLTRAVGKVRMDSDLLCRVTMELSRPAPPPRLEIFDDRLLGETWSSEVITGVETVLACPAWRFVDEEELSAFMTSAGLMITVALCVFSNPMLSVPFDDHEPSTSKLRLFCFSFGTSRDV
jgi:hypothetical protein